MGRNACCWIIPEGIRTSGKKNLWQRQFKPWIHCCHGHREGNTNTLNRHCNCVFTPGIDTIIMEMG
jgi:hypothetical protein